VTDLRPIFIVGAPRSGTTLLRFMLSSHSRIYIPPESDFIPRLFLGRARVSMNRTQAIRAIQVVLTNRRFFREWKNPPIDPQAFVTSLPELTPAAFLAGLYGTYAGQYGATRWGDKSPIYTNYVGLLAEIFPRGQFIHLIRDGRDTALSVLAAYPDRFYVDIYYAARSWRDRILAARRAGLGLGPKRYLEVPYEELTGYPDEILRRVCAFLGEEYEPSMCRQHELARQLLRSRGRHAPVRDPVRRNSGRWRTQMQPADLRVFTAVANGLLHELGYEPAPIEAMRPLEWVRYAALASKYEALEGGRRALQAVGVFHPH
jgi:hypothetical protein